MVVRVYYEGISWLSQKYRYLSYHLSLFNPRERIPPSRLRRTTRRASVAAVAGNIDSGYVDMDMAESGWPLLQMLTLRQTRNRQAQLLALAVLRLLQGDASTSVYYLSENLTQHW